MIVVGIDTGARGGIAVVGPDGAVVWPMPFVERVINGKKRKRVDAILFAKVLRGLDSIPTNEMTAFVETAQASPQMGVSSSFAYGDSFGIVKGALAAKLIHFVQVSPVKWKRALGLIKPGARAIGRDEEREKDSAINLARSLYPQLRAELNYDKDDGKAEALLIAHYGCEELGL